VFYYYVRPVYDLQSAGTPITLDQYPELAERASMKINAENIEAHIEKYIK